MRDAVARWEIACYDSPREQYCSFGLLGCPFSHWISGMNRCLRIVLLVLCVFLSGISTLHLVEYGEILFRHIIDAPAEVDGTGVRAEAIVRPLIYCAFALLCCFYVVPAISLMRLSNPVYSASIVTLPVWAYLVASFHRPELDSFWVSLGAIGAFVGLPVFVAAFITHTMLWTSNFFHQDQTGSS